MAIINFIVTVPDNTPEETIYITGNHDELNNWDPAGIPLAPSEDNTHSVEIELPEGTELEFKFTRGTSASMEADEDFEEIESRVLTVEDDEEISCTVENWADLVNPEEEGTLTGNFRVHRDFYSSSLGDSRTIMVYLPPDYDNEEEAYPVLYLHDGQNVFDSSTSFGGSEWEVDETAERLINEGRIKKIIIVGIYNSKDRDDEYTPSVDFSEGSGGKVEYYANFIIDELKPFIDSNYRTLTSASDTAIMGSSLGGLCSLYLGWQYPHIFSMAGVISPSLWWDDRDIIKAIQEDEDFEGPEKIWLDIGTCEGDEEEEEETEETTDPVEDTRWLAEVLLDKGYVLNESLFYLEAEGADHSEMAWSERVEQILLALFGV